MPSIREALEGAMDEESQLQTQEAAHETAPVSQEETVSTEPTEPETTSDIVETAETQQTTEEKPKGEAKAGLARDEKGKFLSKGKETATKPPEQPLVGAKTGTPQPKPGETTVSRPPQSWKATEKETWAKIPPEAQSAIARRESEITKALEASAPARQHFEQFQNVVSPYVGMIRSQGGDVMRTVENLLQTTYALHTAPPGHRAGIVANIIKTFGIDPGDVASVLQGQAPQQGQGQAQIDPEALLRQAEERFEQRQQQRQIHSLTKHYEQRWDEFTSQNEFASDLREPMMKLIQAGIARDFEDAYNKAASLDPDVSRALKQREEAKQANAQKASTQRARAASSSLKSSPAGPTRPSQATDLRSIVEAAYEKSAGHQR